MGVVRSRQVRVREKVDGVKGEDQSTRRVKLPKRSTEEETALPAGTKKETGQYFLGYEDQKEGQTIN